MAVTSTAQPATPGTVAAENRQPVLFISHGSPEIAVRETPAHLFLKTLGVNLAAMRPAPKAILIVSAHWETATPTVSLTEQPPTLYDFGPRFDRRLWDISYSAPGALAVGKRAHELLTNALGEPPAIDQSRGYDHGVWTPLHLAFPQQTIPVAQISIQPNGPPQHHVKIGEALRPLRDEGVLIIGSGALTHNLSEFRANDIAGEEPDWVSEFRDWMGVHIANDDRAALCAYRTQAPHAQRNHPEDDHILPLFVALGARHPGESARLAHASVEYGVIAMDAYQFG